MLVLISIFASITFAQSAEDSLIDYYVQTISKEIKRAYKQPWPKDAYQFVPKTAEIADFGTFDHIIVGAGSSGAVIANRLSEDSFRHVLLLEAGDYPNNFTNIPTMMGYTIGTDSNWGYLTIPQKTSCLGLKHKQCAFHRGKGIGGTSLINGLVYIRGNKRDYNNWYAEGNYGWSYKDVLPYFKKSENFLKGDPKYHGKGGYLNVEMIEPRNLQIDAFFEANRLMGRKEVDYNAEEQLGFGKTQLNILRGKRHSSGNAFLLPVMERNNLEILAESYVIKILINKNKRAFGVLFSRDGKMYVAKSRKDIILSAGAVGSPQLLMLSGIGPKAHLEDLGIHVVQDLSVGENLLDHTAFCYLDFTTNHTEPAQSIEQNVKDYLSGRGNFINPFNLQALAFLQTKYAKIVGYPDIEMLVVPSINSNEVAHKIWHIQEEVLKQPYNPQNTFTVRGVLLHPKSRGYLRLKSTNPFDYPIINSNMLSDANDEDIKVLYESIKLILEMIHTPPYQKLNTQLKRVNLPACDSYQYMSDKYWYCFLRHLSLPFFHSMGTCKMGTHPSRGAVVNPELKVFGIKHLRVADTSIIPFTISGHTSAAAMMIGEKAADLIKCK